MICYAINMFGGSKKQKTSKPFEPDWPRGLKIVFLFFMDPTK